MNFVVVSLLHIFPRDRMAIKLLKLPCVCSQVVRRGAAPAGGGEVVLKVPVVKQLTAINLTDEGECQGERGRETSNFF